MPSGILIEEYHLSFFVPSSMPVSEQDTIVRTLKRQGFRAKLRQAIRTVLRRHAALHKVRFTLSW